MHFTSWSCWFKIVSIAIAVLPVERVPERVDDAAEQPRADRHRRDLPGAADRLALLHVLPLAEERGADVVLLEVERQSDDAVLELEHLQRDAVLEAVDAGDAVADLEDGADLRQIRLDVELLDPLAQDRRDLFGAQLHLALNSLLGRGRGVVVRAGRARSRRASSIRPGGRSLRSGSGPPSASPGPSGPTPARYGRSRGRSPPTRAPARSSARRRAPGARPRRAPRPRARCPRSRRRDPSRRAGARS